TCRLRLSGQDDASPSRGWKSNSRMERATMADAYIRQAGAIPLRNGRVCLITSRRNGKRWVIPKGLIEPGQTPGATALQHAWEQAGLAGVLEPEPAGSYLYAKYAGTSHVP